MSTATATPTIVTTPCGVTAMEADFGEGPTAILLTPCCEATGKGASTFVEGSSGVVCRGCYREVPTMYAIEGFSVLREAAEVAGCATPHACAISLFQSVTGRPPGV